jgi:hypothetical protein
MLVPEAGEGTAPMSAKSVMTPSVLIRLLQPSTSSETMFGISRGSHHLFTGQIARRHEGSHGAR